MTVVGVHVGSSSSRGMPKVSSRGMPKVMFSMIGFAVIVRSYELSVIHESSHVNLGIHACARHSLLRSTYNLSTVWLQLGEKV